MTQKPKTQAKRGRGRPPHVPTAASRHKVSVAAGAGMRHADIAIALGISHDTLSRYYEAELTEGALARRMEVVNAMHAAAKKGQSSAARVYLEHVPQLAAPPLPAPQPDKPAAEPKPAPLGKKERANLDSKTAQQGTGWEDILPSASTPVQ